MPEPMPLDGILNGENRLELMPCAVMVTTDARAAATTSVRAWGWSLVTAGCAATGAAVAVGEMPINGRPPTADTRPKVAVLEMTADSSAMLSNARKLGMECADRGC